MLYMYHIAGRLMSVATVSFASLKTFSKAASSRFRAGNFSTHAERSYGFICSPCIQYSELPY